MPLPLGNTQLVEFRNLRGVAGKPHTSYGAAAVKLANEVSNKRLQRLTDREKRLILSNNEFAKNILSAFGYPNSNDEILKLRTDIYTSNPRLASHIDTQTGAIIEPLPLAQEQRYFGEQQYLPAGDVNNTWARAARNSVTYPNLKKQEADILENARRLAPLQPLHERAKGKLLNNTNNESLRLAAREIAAAGRTEIPREIEPYLQQASQDPAEFVRRYGINYQGLINNFRQEASRDFLEHDLPRINNQYAHRGAFHSSARQHAIDKARADKERSIQNEISKLLVHGQEQGMKHYHEHRSGSLKAAEVKGHAAQAEKDSRLKAAENLRANAAVGHATEHQDISALSQMARMEQQQKQNELNVLQQEHQEAYEMPRREIEREAALLAGIQPPYQAQLSPANINPAPPNPYALGAGLIGQMAGLAGQPQQQGFAKGGLIRRGYASGDSVARAVSQLAALRKGVVESPEEEEMHQTAQNFKNHRANPMADYLFAAGSHQLANLGENPMKTYGEGAQLGMQAYKHAQGENLSTQEKYHNLMDKRNQTKMLQHQLLAKHHNSQQQFEEQQRYHNATLGESKRAHDMMYGQRMGSGEEKPIKMSATQKKLEHDAQKDLLRAVRMKKELGELGGLIKQTSTGPLIGGIKSMVPSTKIDNKITAITNKLILDMHQGMKNIPRSEEFMKRIESTKPNTRNYAETNQSAIDMMDEGANDVLENSISSLLSAGWTPEKIEKRFKIKVPKHFLEDGEETAQESLSDFSGIPQGDKTGGMVPIIGPDGEEWMIPHANVEAALQAGGQLAQ